MPMSPPLNLFYVSVYGLNSVPCQIYTFKFYFSWPQHITLFGDRVFTDIIKLKFVWNIIQYEWCLIKGENLDTHMENAIWRLDFKKKKRNQDDAFTCQGVPKIATKPSEARGETWKTCFFIALRRNHSWPMKSVQVRDANTTHSWEFTCNFWFLKT